MKTKKRNPRDTQQQNARASALRVLKDAALKTATGGGHVPPPASNDGIDPIC